MGEVIFDAARKPAFGRREACFVLENGRTIRQRPFAGWPGSLCFFNHFCRSEFHAPDNLKSFLDQLMQRRQVAAKLPDPVGELFGCHRVLIHQPPKGKFIGLR